MKTTTDDFKEWIESKIQGEFPINNNFLLVCLDDAIRLGLNTTLNGNKIIDVYSHEEFMMEILSSWLRNATTFLGHLEHGANMNFGGQPVPLPQYRQELLFQLCQLAKQCVNL